MSFDEILDLTAGVFFSFYSVCLLFASVCFLLLRLSISAVVNATWHHSEQSKGAHHERKGRHHTFFYEAQTGGGYTMIQLKQDRN